MPDWIRCKQDPQYDKLYGDRLYQIESGCEIPWEEDGYMWHRLQCSYWFGDWIEANATKDVQWKTHGARHRAIYIVREDLMTFIRLKFL